MIKASAWFGLLFIVAMGALNTYGALTSSSAFLRTICAFGALLALALVVVIAWVFRKAARGGQELDGSQAPRSTD